MGRLIGACRNPPCTPRGGSRSGRYHVRRLSQVAPMNPPDYKFSLQLDDGTSVTIRAIRPNDAAIEQDFVKSLSLRSRTQRFFAPIKELSATALKKFTNTDFPDAMALVATVDQKGIERQIGVARYAPSASSGRVEFAVVVADDWQGKGIANELLRHLFSIASEVESAALRRSYCVTTCQCSD